MNIDCTEDWRDIPGYEGFYQASTQGLIRTIYNDGRARAGNVMSPIQNWDRQRGKRYVSVTLRGHRPARRFLVHRLIALTFLGPIPDGKQVNHKNGEHTDNALSNLEYCTARENMIHAVAMGKNRQAKFCAEQITEILLAKGTLTQIGAMFSVTASCIHLIKKRKSYTHVSDPRTSVP